MDPTFGGQELLESLSQASSTAKSRQSKDSRSKSSRGSSNSTLTSTHTNPVEDAYRRIGQGLSQRAQGDDRHVRQQQQRARLGTHPCTSFGKYHRPAKVPFNPHDLVGHPHPTQGGPSSKIPKLGGSFQDTGGSTVGGDSASGKPSQKLLKKITVQAKETFHKWRRQQKAGYLNKYNPSSGSLPRSSNASFGTLDQYGHLTEQQLLVQQHGQQQSMTMQHSHTSPERYTLLQMALQQQQQQQINDSIAQAGVEDQPKGLLSAVLEGGSDSAYESESVHSLPTINSQKTGVSRNSLRGGAGASAYHQYPGPGSLGGSTVSLSGNSMSKHQLQHPHTPVPAANAAAQPALHYATPRGRCLTQPGEPVGNEGLDNAEGNMLLFQSDILVVPGRATKAGSLPSNSQGLEFHVQSMLGQGTFAQVFCCWESVSKKRVALKIIKNKPAFTKQAAVEIEVFQALAAKSTDGNKADTAANVSAGTPASPHMVHLLSSFMYKSHLCLVFECLGMNLYEVLKRRQFRGLPLPMVRTLVKQALEGVKELAAKTIVHCDLKPENILLVGEEAENEVLGAGELYKGIELKGSNNSVSSVASNSPQTIKLIDFGSACFEGYSAHTYIQSRFYRSPEVLMGLPYDSAIDVWSLGCVAAELFLGLPILPGVHEHDQCGRIIEMIGDIPDWMLEQGIKASKYYVKFVAPRNPGTPGNGSTGSGSGGSSSSDQAKAGQSSSSDANNRPILPQWRLKTQDEYIKSLTQNEIRKKGGIAKLEKQPANRYFKRTKLSDIIMLHGQHCVGDDKELLGMFVHFLYGLLDPDPWKRWTAHQASQHPFITGTSGQLRKKTPQTKLDYKEENQANCNFDMYWQPPWDPGICRRKLLNVQRMREKQSAQRRGYAQSRQSHSLEQQQQSPTMNSVNSRAMVPDSPSVGHMSVDGKNSPPSQIAGQAASQQAKARAGRGMSAGSMPNGGIASSMSAIGNSGGLSSALGTENPNRNEHLMNTPSNKSQSMFVGPQSYTGLGNFEDGPNEADFAYALQRPGNVPALSSSIASSHAGGTSVGSAQPHRMHQQQYQQPQHYSRMHQGSLQGTLQSSMHGSVPKYPGGGGHVSSVNSLPNSAVYPNQGAGMMGVGGVSFQGQGGSVGGLGGSLTSSGRFDEQAGGVQYLAQQRQLQKQQASGKSQQQQQQPGLDQMPPHLMTEYHHQLLVEQQQKQLAAMQQQHQQQLAALQQQQQMAFQQQQQQFLSQQYGGTTGNGYYYVTSGDGTPMMVQGGGPPMGTSYDGPGSGPYLGMPPHQQQGMPGYDIGGGGSVRDSRSNQRLPRSARRGSDNYRGGPGMSM